MGPQKSMSRAFVKDDDGGEGVEDLPDRLISPHANLVTPEGLAQIEEEIATLTAAYAAARTAADRNALQKVARDLRYWTARRASAEVVPPPADDREVQFGSTVTLQRDDGRVVRYRIVGEDEADPAKGSISYVSPLARALMGKAMGDAVTVGAIAAGITAIT
jgi:transcription elongation GreA/GreB family factor